jgi:glycyl-tRNA synthetase beta chain
MSNDLLFELGSEELPSGAVKLLAQSLADNLKTYLADAQLTHGEVYPFATPRRIAVLVHDLQTRQANQQVLRRGPSVAVARDTPAVVGFARSCGVAVDQLTTTKTEKGEWWAYEATAEGVDTVDLMPAILSKALAALPIAKPMRWGDGDIQFARPVHWAVLLFGEAVIHTTLLGVDTGRDSFGHRYHHPEAVTITTPNLYDALLKKAKVIVDYNARRQLIIEQITALAKHENCHVVMPDALVDEVTSIVEWPNALLAQFDPAFLEVPAEALIAAMQQHQKCFALRDSQGQLLPKFITVANIQSISSDQVVKGNEKVMHARLSDAAFFFNQDKKQALSFYQPATEQVIFQKQLGSLADKARRMQFFMQYLAPILNLDEKQAQRAAFLSKCDLMTGMVGEFPELQGLMGYYYARLDGEAENVALALNEQYMPRFAADKLPLSDLGRAMSLADRMDMLVGAFALGQKPTGVKDPFKLRRHALAVVRLLVDIPKSLSLSNLIREARTSFGDSLSDGHGSDRYDKTISEAALAELKPFILERMQSFYQSQNVSLDVVRAVRARQEDCLFDFNQRISALLAFTQLPEAQALAAACKRVNNLLQQTTRPLDGQTIQVSLLQETSENALVEDIQAMERLLEPSYRTGDYAAILTKLASLRVPVDSFFEQVMVMVDDGALRENRLCILQRLQSLLQGVADISLLQPLT